jgi:hypothetical protein
MTPPTQSYDRPLDLFDKSGFLAVEYPAVRWLEANGYDVSYVSGVDTDRLGGRHIHKHRVFVSAGHDEYWSEQQWRNVEQARGLGTHLLFLSGNEIFWKIRWEPSVYGVPHRVMVCHKSTCKAVTSWLIV